MKEISGPYASSEGAYTTCDTFDGSCFGRKVLTRRGGMITGDLYATFFLWSSLFKCARRSGTESKSLPWQELHATAGFPVALFHVTKLMLQPEKSRRTLSRTCCVRCQLGIAGDR